MGTWLHRVKVVDAFHDEDLAFMERRDVIVARLKELPMYDEEGTKDHNLWWIVDQLTDALNEDDFNYAWDELYDWADRNRVWIETFE